MPSIRPERVDFEEIARLARSGGAAGLPDATLRAQADLFAAHGGGRNGEDRSVRDAFIALALSLIPRVTAATLRTVAARLAPLSFTPPEVLGAIHAAGGAPAAQIIAAAPSLPVALRRAALAEDDPRLAAAFAVRADLTEAEQTALVMRQETAIRRALATQPGALARPVIAALIDAARMDDRLAGLLMMREDVDPASILPLYRFAAPERRAAIRAALDRRAAERGLSLPDIRAGADDVEALMAASLEGMESFAAQLAITYGRGGGMLASMRQDDSREIMALALRALDLAPEDAIRMLLRTGDAVARDSAALGRLVDILRHCERATATAILAANWPRAASAPAAQHQPVMAEGGTPSRLPATAVKPARPRRPRPGVIEQLRGNS